MADRPPPRGARRLLVLCLRAWPAADRRARGRELVETSLDTVRDAEGAAAWRELAGEGYGLVTGGLRRRFGGARHAIVQSMKGWAADARYAVRTLRRSPVFAGVAVLTLALGIGANTAVFSLADAVLLRPPPYADAERLVLVWNTLPGSSDRVPVAGPDAAVLQERARTLGSVAFTIRGVDGAVETGAGDGARHVRMAAVTHDFFDVLGVDAALGRTFGAEDAPVVDPAAPAAAPTVVLAHGLWRSAFGGDPAVLGRAIRLNGIPITVAGVMPEGFSLTLPPDAGVATDIDVWIPFQVPLTAFHRDDGRLLDQDSDNTGAIVARLAPGADLAAARAELDRIAADLRKEVPLYADADMGFDVRALHADATDHARPVLLALLLGAGVVLLVACLNIATLVLARSLGRAREFAVRASLGAGRLRLARQLLVESAVLVAFGLGAGLALAALALPALAALVPPSLTPVAGLALDGRALTFAALLAGGAAATFGVLPALRMGRPGAGALLAGGAVRGGPGRERGRHALVAAEVALSVGLVLCAAMLLRTVDALDRVRPGFETADALTFRLSMRVPEAYRSPASRAELVRTVERRVAALPGVTGVGLVGVLPLTGQRWTQPYGLPGQAPDEWQANRADFRVVTSGFFEAMGTRLVEGRTFTSAEDLTENERVVVVDETLAARIAPGGSAVGAVVGVPLDGAAVEARVVGVVEHVRYDRLDADGREAIYVPYRQEATREIAFVVRTRGDAASLAPAVRRTVGAVDPSLPVYAVRPLADHVAEAVAPRRFALTMLGVFAALALLGAAVGLYGVVAFDVARRTRDIGLRMAVGADAGRVVRSVLAGGLRVTAWGLAAGVVVGAVAVGFLRGMIFGVAPTDALTWAGVLALVVTVTMAATWVPARRASRLSPTEALRSE